MSDWLESVRFDPDGLVPAIAQDAATHRVLTLAWMNRLALERTADLHRRELLCFADLRHLPVPAVPPPSIDRDF